MNVYDFDGTIYSGDSSVSFYFFILKRHPSVLRVFPKQLWAMIMHKCGKISLTEAKEAFFSFLPIISDISNETKLFCERRKNKIMSWYKEKQKADDLIISASPEFLLKGFCQNLGGVRLIASEVDSESGKFLSENCKGEEKVKRFKKAYGNEKIEEFYSDSYSDLPMGQLAERAYLVKNGRPCEWKLVKGEV